MPEADLDHRRANRVAAAALALLSLLPVWPTWRFAPWAAVGENASFWAMLASLPHALEQQSPEQLIAHYYGPALLLPAGLTAGALLLARRPRGSPRSAGERRGSCEPPVTLTGIERLPGPG